MFSKIDNLLNSITMYRLVLYGLVVLAILSFILTLLQILSLDPLVLSVSFVLLFISCFATNHVLSKFLKIPSNTESSAITSLILFFILSPSNTLQSYLLVFLAGVLTIASKYVIVYHRKHIFNPAALGSFVVGFLGLGVSWWVGSEALLLPMVVLGFLVVRKIRKFTMLFSFLLPALIVMLIFGYTYNQPPLETLKFAFTSWPLLFLGTIILTEPITAPSTKRMQMVYGAIVGIITTYQIPVFNFYVTPEFALLIGNIFAFAVSPKWRLKLTLEKIQKLSPTTDAFIFDKPTWVKFKPGQYMEWTLPHSKADSRGIRRYFTIASSPTEGALELGVKKYNPSSTFKNALFSLKPGDVIYAGQLKGDFILPKDTTKKLVFIAGGIGITPFRSMLKYLIDSREKRDIIFIHYCGSSDEFTYKDIVDQARSIGVKAVYVDSSKGQHLTEDVIKTQVTDYEGRKYYISGSSGMVHGVKGTLNKLGIKPTSIKTDYFAGL